MENSSEGPEATNCDWRGGRRRLYQLYLSMLALSLAVFPSTCFYAHFELSHSKSLMETTQFWIFLTIDGITATASILAC